MLKLLIYATHCDSHIFEISGSLRWQITRDNRLVWMRLETDISTPVLCKQIAEYY